MVGGVSILLTQHLPGVLPFTLNRLLIFEQADAFPDPVPRPGSGPAMARSLPSQTEGSREDGKQGREGESVRQNVRGWNKSKTDVSTRVSQHFESWEEMGRLWSPTTFPFISSSHFPASYRCFACTHVTSESLGDGTLTGFLTSIDNVFFHVSWPTGVMCM